MRIAVAGKGGAGKTTIAATAARLFARRGFAVHAIDDDPNPNLSAALGVAREQAATLRRAPREDILEEVPDASGETILRLRRPFAEVLQTYGVRGPDGVDVLTMTGLVGAGKG